MTGIRKIRRNYGGVMFEKIVGSATWWSGEWTFEMIKGEGCQMVIARNIVTGEQRDFTGLRDAAYWLTQGDGWLRLELA
jgi:hypothetical protein